MPGFRITDMVSDGHYVVTADFPDEEEAWNWACATFGPGASECMTVELLVTPDPQHDPSFAQLRVLNVSRAARWHPGFPGADTDWTGGDWGNAMAGECGEACNVIKKLRRVEGGYEDGRTYEPGELLEALGRELADVVTYSDLIAAKYDLDLGYWLAKKFNEVSQKWGFPERFPFPPEA